VDTIVAPYEADAQLAYLAQNGFADLVITEDSDLVMYGCDKVLFKLDPNGGGVLVEKNKLHLCLGLPTHKFNMELFRHACILSGCDYIASLPGIGLTKAFKFFNLTEDTDTRNVLKKLPTYLRMPSLEVTEEYREGFMRAVNTVLHQLVFCPRERKLRPLNEPEDGSTPSERPFCGEFVGHEKALQIALANVDFHTKQKMADYSPDGANSPRDSIWCEGGRVRKRKLEETSHEERPFQPSSWKPASQETKKPAKLSLTNEGGSKYFRTAKSESFAMKENVPSVLETMDNVTDLLSMYKCSKSENADKRGKVNTKSKLARFSLNNKYDYSLNPESETKPIISNTSILDMICNEDGNQRDEEKSRPHVNPFSSKLSRTSTGEESIKNEECDSEDEPNANGLTIDEEVSKNYECDSNGDPISVSKDTGTELVEDADCDSIVKPSHSQIDLSDDVNITSSSVREIVEQVNGSAVVNKDEDCISLSSSPVKEVVIKPSRVIVKSRFFHPDYKAKNTNFNIFRQNTPLKTSKEEADSPPKDKFNASKAEEMSQKFQYNSPSQGSVIKSSPFPSKLKVQTPKQLSVRDMFSAASRR